MLHDDPPAGSSADLRTADSNSLRLRECLLGPIPHLLLESWVRSGLCSALSCQLGRLLLVDLVERHGLAAIEHFGFHRFRRLCSGAWIRAQDEEWKLDAVTSTFSTNASTLASTVSLPLPCRDVGVTT